MTGKLATTELGSPRVTARAVRPGTWLAAFVVLACSACVVFAGLASEPHFADESAMIAQSYYWPLFKRGHWNHPNWLHYAAYDHPPLPKYMFGLFLELAGLPVPSSIAAWEQWSAGDFSPPADPRVLYWSRIPSALAGVGGALAVFLIGLALRGRMFGVLAAALVVFNPLYLTHARRAMSDSFAECFVLASVAAGLWGARLVWSCEFRWRAWLSFGIVASLSCGLAALAKLNGGIATVFVLANLAMNWCAAMLNRSRQPATCVRTNGVNLALTPLAALSVGLASLFLFVLLNPYLTARPTRLEPSADPKAHELAGQGVLERAKYLVQFRRDWTESALKNEFFRANRLSRLPDRTRMTVLEGFGRYALAGPRDIRTITIKGFDREPADKRLSVAELPGWLRGDFRRMDSDTDGFVDDRELTTYLDGGRRISLYRRITCVVWFPLFVVGLVAAARSGRGAVRSRTAPLAWGLILYAAAVLAIVVFMIPLNWDRYYLPIQPAAALIVLFGLAGVLDYVRSRLVLQPAAQS